jgi:hypothetical protein
MPRGKPKGAPKTGGRQKGTPNKNTAILKDAILTAATLAGGEKDGLVGYLKIQAMANPGPFMALLGKVLPMQIAGDAENPLQTFTRIELIGVRSTDQDTR